MPGDTIRLSITVAALLVALAHLIFPGVRIDFVTVVLLVVAVLPWVAPIVKSVELPGGFKIQLQDVKEAAKELLRVDTVIQPPTGEIRMEGHAPEVVPDAKARIKFEAEVVIKAEAAVTSLKNVAGTDPNLALVGFRIEIEKRLRELARNKALDPSLPLSAILRELRRRELLPSRVSSALSDLIALGNQAAHGVAVDPRTAEWVFEEGADILVALDRMLRAQ
jgi:membrane protein implicated in regulation of membrane protease activity